MKNPKHSKWMKDNHIIPPSRKGVKLSEETKLKISLNNARVNLGKKFSAETRQKMREAKLKNPVRYWLGKKRPDISIGQLGEKNKMWEGGITPLGLKIRNSPEYKQWRKNVIDRDKRCMDCGSVEKLEAHHIKSQWKFPSLRFLLCNGKTLCRSCHIKTDNYGGKRIDK